MTRLNNFLLPQILFCLAGFALAEETPEESTKRNWYDRNFWQTTSGKPATEGWEFRDGEIALVDPRKASHILTPPLPPNFELEWKWKIEKGVNSGLKYRVRRFGKAQFGNTYLGVEYQIIDSSPSSTSKSSTAAIYDLVEPKAKKTLHPPGEWNHGKVIARGEKIEHYLNGTLVASAVMAGPAWETTVALSKFLGCDGFGQPREGDRIMLTDHGGKVTYKDFQFTAYDDEVVEPPRTGPFLANATRNSWADQNSIVIWTRTTRNPEMLVDGKKFVSLSNKEASALAKQSDPKKLLDPQLPEGAQLDEMIGACPGAPGQVRVSYYPGSQRKATKHTKWIITNADSDFTAQWKLEGLKPDTKYTTVTQARTLDGKPSAVIHGAFRTAPKASEAKPIKFCITTCHDFIRRDDGMQGHKIYPAMNVIRPDFVVHAGDIEYYDKPDPWALTKELMRFKWGRIFALPNNRDFYNRTSSYFIKDDHDTLKNDSWPGQTYGSVTFDEGVALFNEEQFPSRNPRYANIRWGRDLEIWILEGRDYRSPNTMPDGPEKSILGKKQKEWLFKTLKESDAKFKLICSPTPIVGPDRANKKDNHANEIFAYEGNQIRETISKIPGVIVFCGDRHWQYASVDDETNLWEFGCGPGSEKHQLGWKPGDERPVHRFLRVKGGFLSGEVKYRKNQEPTLTIRHHSVEGKPVSSFQFPTAE
ncbi:family 16 glycoside hydrolase [Thalassoroseus pseudoceratinae]|uniref:family 16 glycoside hydrolase n=1 Tax=Thalassoroseus pseudoceratinae TaxID=2713176 RepID=UPI00141ED00D|nr:family 16 glycoside hydrolase [Thalassoroseus pseudoceratinae]